MKQTIITKDKNDLKKLIKKGIKMNQLMSLEDLAKIGLDIIGNPKDAVITPFRRRFYGSSLRIESKDLGLDVYVKENPRNYCNEAKVIEYFTKIGFGSRVPNVVGASQNGSVVVTEACGETVRDVFWFKTKNINMPILKEALIAHIDMQIAADQKKLIKLGALNFPSESLSNVFDSYRKRSLENSQFNEEQLKNLGNLIERTKKDVERLVELNLGSMWDHGDFGSGNVLIGSGGAKEGKAVFIDLSEPAIVSPCFPAAHFIKRLEKHMDIDPCGTEMIELKKCWAEDAAWKLGKDESALKEGFEICLGELQKLYWLIMKEKTSIAYFLEYDKKVFIKELTNNKINTDWWGKEIQPQNSIKLK